MNILKRTKRLWALTKKDADSLDAFMKLKDSEIMDLPDEEQSGVWLGEGTIEEFEEQTRKDKGFFNKPFGL